MPSSITQFLQIHFILDDRYGMKSINAYKCFQIHINNNYYYGKPINGL